MTIAYWCVLIAGLLPYLAVGFAKRSRDYDNHQPREWVAKQDAGKQRAYAAHLNSFEVFPLFAAAVIIAQHLEAQQNWLDGLAVAFIVVRLIYIAMYLKDKATLRSVMWLLGTICVVGIFVLAAMTDIAA
jgi:uncharacterized MAPEG superfamily protein